MGNWFLRTQPIYYPTKPTHLTPLNATYDESMNCHSHELTTLEMAAFLLDTSGPKFKVSKYMISFLLMSMTIKYQCVSVSFSGR